MVVRRITEIAREVEGVASVVAFAGFDVTTGTNAPNKAALFSALAPFEERVRKGLSGPKIMAELRAKVSAIDEALVLVFPPPPVRGMGNLGGFRMMVQDRRGRGYVALQQAAQEVVAEGAKRPPLIGLFSGFRANAPQFSLIDRTKAQMLRVPMENVFDTLQTQLGSIYVNDLNLYGRTFRVIAQADARFREDPEDVGKLHTRSATGASVPLGTILSVSRAPVLPAWSGKISIPPPPSMAIPGPVTVPARRWLLWPTQLARRCLTDLAPSGPPSLISRFCGQHCAFHLPALRGVRFLDSGRLV